MLKNEIKSAKCERQNENVRRFFRLLLRFIFFHFVRSVYFFSVGSFFFGVGLQRSKMLPIARMTNEDVIEFKIF